MIDRSTKWGNPFKIGDPNVASLDGEPMTREQVISLYESWITGRRDMMDSLKELRGKVLGCHCKPLPCHGDVLCRLMIDRFGTRIPYLIANCVVCTPPRINGKIREPTKAEKVECEAHLRELIGKHNPLLIVALGEHAHRSLTRVEHLHLIHPAALLRYPERRMDIAVQECINTLRREVGARGL
jgi:hypothetical protein